MQGTVRRFLLSATLILAVAAGSMSGARDALSAIINLGFLMDESGSVGQTNYTTAINALSSALSLIPTSGANQYRVGVVSFSTAARTVVAPTIVTAGNIAGIQAAVAGDPYNGGFTNMEAAIDLIVSDFSAAGMLADETSLINMTTDGVPFGGNTIDVSEAGTLARRDIAAAAGWDGLSVEAIGTGVDIPFLQELAFPGLGTLIGPGDVIPNPLNQGFVLAVSNFDEYTNAIRTKVQRIVDPTPNPVPLPAALPLLAVGLGILGFFGRRRKLVTTA